MNNQVNDPWESAENPQLPSFETEIWGLCDIDSFFCVLEKGTGKVAFNDQIHSADQRRTAIDIKITPLPEMNISTDISRSLIAESREWAGVILPSIKDLGVRPPDLNGKWVHVSRVGYTDYKGNPSTYTDKSGNERESLTFKFMKIFAGQDECLADYIASRHAAVGQPVNNPAVAPSQPTTQVPASQPATTNNKERETAVKFLKVVVENCARGQSDIQAVLSKIAAAIPGFPLVAKYFTAESPETLNFVMEVMK